MRLVLIIVSSFFAISFTSNNTNQMENQNIQQPTVLLLKGTRWTVEGFFESFGKKIVVNEHPGLELPHEVKTGLSIWDGSIALAKYFETDNFSPGFFKGKKVIELGAGCGLLGLTLAAEGAKVILSDLHQLIPLLQKNIEANGFEDTAEAKELSWGMDKIESIPKQDIIVASDCLWVDYLVVPFMETLVQLSSKETIIFISYEQRSKQTEEHFLELAKKHFFVEKIPFEKMHPNYRDRYIDIYKLQLNVNE